ncbi:hypothetical protein HNI00_07295 [Thermoleptolyngbya oregonensis NK1-22]|uniref:Uncharacterized protein n=1 Tax=Thermoleptolyngbya oregonensis NK1-22 TaxID=2547457 RepID=A0AA96Y4B3_9CYAN|nr:hypothetical protein [Thermoleptolyngbya oregonensis]WOB42981.1 hypothetical protein HNI00_07295 [Thermoleptolyngbya oregonensis NK1-22]
MLERLTYRTQKVVNVLFVILVLLTGLRFCLASALYVKTASEPTKTTIDQVAAYLAKKDGDRYPVDEYKTLLTRLDARCSENHEVVAGFGVAFAKKYQEVTGEWMPAIEGLQTLEFELQNERGGQVNCMRVYQKINN